MADNDVRITGIDDSAKQTLSGFGWATEATLQKLLNNGKVSVQLLQSIARNRSMSDSAFKDMQRAADEVNKTAKTGSKQFDSALSGFRRTVNDIGNSTKQSAKEAIDGIGKLGAKGADQIGQAAYKTQSLLSKMTGGIKGLFTGGETKFETVISDMGSGLKNWVEQFKPSGILGKIIVGAAGMFGSLVAVVGNAIGALRDMNTMVRELYKSGIRPEGGFEALAQTAIATGLSMENLTKIITNFGAVAATLGTKRMMDLQKQFAVQTKLGGKFMMTQSELQEALGDSMEMMRVSGELRGATDQQIAARADRSISMFNELALATGKNRDELRKATSELMKSTKQFGLMRAAGKGSGEAIQGLMASLTAEFGNMAPQLADMVEGMFMGGPALVDEAMRPLLAIVPGFGNELQDITAGIKSGALNPQQAAVRMSDIIDRIDEGTLQTLRAANPALYGTIRQMQMNTQQAREARANDASLTAEEREARENELKKAQARQAAFNEMDKAMTGLRTAFNTFLARAVEPLLPVFQKVAEIVSKVTEKWSEKLGEFFKTIDWDAKTKAIHDWLDAINPDDVIKQVGGFLSTLTEIISTVTGLAGSFLNLNNWLAKIIGIDPGTAFLSLLAGGALATVVAGAIVTGAVQTAILRLFGGGRGNDPNRPLFVTDVSGGGGPGQGQGGDRRGGGDNRRPPGRGPGGPAAPGGGRGAMLMKALTGAVAGYEMLKLFDSRQPTPAADLMSGGAGAQSRIPTSGAAPGVAQPSVNVAGADALRAGGRVQNLINTGVDVASAIGIGARLVPGLIAMAGDTIAGTLGVGQEPVAEEQDDKNWEAMSTLEKLESGTARFIEGAGRIFGLSNIANQARADRIKSETAYLEAQKKLQTDNEEKKPLVDVREIERTVTPLQDQTVKDLNEEFADGNQQNQESMDKLLNAIVAQMEIQRETNARLEDGFRRLTSAVEDTGPIM